MKHYFILLILMLSIHFVSAADLKTDTVKVYGNCEMCQQRITTAASMKGVKSARWDINTGLLIVSYDAEKITLEKIEQRIAAAGHDTEHFKANDKVYQSMHQCCRYERRP